MPPLPPGITDLVEPPLHLPAEMPALPPAAKPEGRSQLRGKPDQAPHRVPQQVHVGRIVHVSFHLKGIGPRPYRRWSSSPRSTPGRKCASSRSKTCRRNASSQYRCWMPRNTAGMSSRQPIAQILPIQPLVPEFLLGIVRLGQIYATPQRP